jgi:hypothetical protein
VSLCRVPWARPPPLADLISGREAYETGRASGTVESASSRPRRFTTMTRAPRSLPARRTSVASCARSPIRPDALAATTNACVAASFFTSASIRRARFSASGTSSATMISSST